MERWLPASLKNSDNPFYEVLLEEADKIIEKFLNERVRTKKNIYSISNSSLEDLMDIAENIYLLDKNILKGAYRFLYTQSSTDSEERYPAIVKITSLFYQLDLIPFSREVVEPGGYTYIQEGVHLPAPLTTDFSTNQAVQFFRDMIESYVPGVKVSIEGDSNNEFYFIYPIGSTEEMKESNLQSLRNTLCDYAIDYEDGFTDMLSVDPVTEGWVLYIKDQGDSYEIKAASNPEVLPSLGETIKFHVPYSSYETDLIGMTLTIDCSSANQATIERFRDEISKIPRSIANRGTYPFYSSMFNTFGFNFPGVISLMKSEDNNRNGRLIDNISLAKHGMDISDTSLVSVPVNETFTAQENITNILDDNIGTELDPEYRTLDSFGLFNRLDMISSTEDTIYKKDILAGFQINENHFNGQSIYPAEFSKFIQELIMLNQKATDVIHVTPMVSVNIDKADMGESKSLPASNEFMTVTSSSSEYALIKEFDDFHLKMEAFEYDESSDSYEKFYDYQLNEDIDLTWKPDENDSCLTVKALVEGKRWRLSNLTCNTVSSKKITCEIPDGYESCVTKNMILKLFNKGEEDINYLLFKEDHYGRFIQNYGPTDEGGDFLYDVNVSISGNLISFESDRDFANLDPYEMTFVSEKDQTQVSKVRLIGEYLAAGERLSREIWSVDFRNEENHLYIDLPLNVNLMMLVSRHEQAQE